MLLRWQTFILCLVALLLLAAPYFIIAQGSLLSTGAAWTLGPKGAVGWVLKPCSLRFVQGINSMRHTFVWPYALSVLVAAGLSLATVYTIGRHNSRTQQLELCKWNGRGLLLLQAWYMGLVLYCFVKTVPPAFAESYQAMGGLWLRQLRGGCCLPFVAYWLTRWASRLIGQDEALVRSADRLR